MDGLADAYIQFLYLLTGQNLFVLPQFFVEKAQFGAVVDDVRNLFLIHTGIVRDVEQTVGIHDHIASLDTVDLVYNEMEHTPAFHSKFIF